VSDHEHAQDHLHAHGAHDDQAIDPATDPTISPKDLSPDAHSRRQFLIRTGALGVAAGIASTGIGFVDGAPVDAATAPDHRRQPFDESGPDDFTWLAGDHHIHTQYSPDALYRIMQQVEHASTFGLGWMVITDHGGVDHQKFSVDLTHPDIVASRAAYKDMLIFQGFEWNIPSAEHGTIFVAPGPNEKDLLKVFEGNFDGVVQGQTASSAVNEQHAIDAVAWLHDAVKTNLIDDALFLANHPARKGIDSPHEVRNWRDTAPDIAVGMEGAPGHQAEGVASPLGAGGGRGGYGFSSTADSFAGYPVESYRTFGGFDWMTATVGGFWDSLLAEGKGWWITANSDSHKVWRDTWTQAGAYTNGKWADPSDSLAAQASYSDFAPGQYSRTVVGARHRDYRAVMEGIRRGRIWVSHGALIRGLAVTASAGDARSTLGGTLRLRRGKDVRVKIEIALNPGLNYNGDAPRLRRVDLIAGPVTGPTAIPAGGITTGPDANRDGISAPGTKVVKQFDVSATAGKIVLEHTFHDVEAPFYLRVRGTDGQRIGTARMSDPTPPLMDVLGNANPWADLWFYTNPIFVVPGG
jgi:PHP domain